MSTNAPNNFDGQPKLKDIFPNGLAPTPAPPKKQPTVIVLKIEK